MKLFLTSAYKEHSRLDRLIQLQKLDVHQRHKLTDDAASADAIVFVENTQFKDILFEQLLRHPVYRAHPEKAFMYNEMDRSWPMLPGLYCSLSANMAASSDHVAFPYINICNDDIKDIHAKECDRKWLYSFVGSGSHAVRKPILELQDDAALIVDTSDFCVWTPTQTGKYEFQKMYTDSIAQSKFVLCPRGIGPSSLRLFETIEAGRIPVIVSDSWIAPSHVDWSFAVRIPEWEIAAIPQRLRELENEWEDRGRAARAAWEAVYAPDQLFNTFADTLESIRHSANLPSPSLRISAHKFRVYAEQAIRNWIRPPAGLSSPSPAGTLETLSPKQTLLSKSIGEKS